MKIKFADTHLEWHQDYSKCSLDISWYSPLDSVFSFSYLAQPRIFEGQMSLCCPQRKILLLAGRISKATLKLDLTDKHTSKKEPIWAASGIACLREMQAGRSLPSLFISL